jgi:hypothetical protein
MQVVGAVDSAAGVSVSLRVRDGDWPALRALSLWLFHTPPGAVRALPEGVPVVAAIKVTSPDRQDQEVKVPVVAPAFTSTTAIPTESAA